MIYKSCSVAFLFFIALGSMAPAIAADDQSYPKILQAIAQDISILKNDFPQLKDFSVDKVNIKELKISYQYRTHAAPKTGGWTSGVPNPDDDGIWFYIDIHNPDSNLQIHAQPVAIPLCLNEKRVSFLILEGSKTKSLYGPIYVILSKHGVVECRR